MKINKSKFLKFALIFILIKKLIAMKTIMMKQTIQLICKSEDDFLHMQENGWEFKQTENLQYLIHHEQSK